MVLHILNPESRPTLSLTHSTFSPRLGHKAAIKFRHSNLSLALPVLQTMLNPTPSALSSLFLTRWFLASFFRVRGAFDVLNPKSGPPDDTEPRSRNIGSIRKV